MLDEGGQARNEEAIGALERRLSTFIGEDQAIVESVQRGLRSGALPNAHCTAWERPNRDFQRYLAHRVLVRLTRVDVQPFNQVGLEFAASEGEGDLSLEYWRQAHRDYFDKFCAKFGLDWQEDSPVVCESFELIHP